MVSVSVSSVVSCDLTFALWLRSYRLKVTVAVLVSMIVSVLMLVRWLSI